MRARESRALDEPQYPRARKRFGQHFLERAWVDKLIAALGTSPDDTFLEIGPGRGALTRALAPHVARIVAVEIDRSLAAALPAHAPSHVRVVTGDFLDVDLDEVLRYLGVEHPASDAVESGDEADGGTAEGLGPA